VPFSERSKADEAKGGRGRFKYDEKIFMRQDGRFSGIYAATQNLPVEAAASGWQ